MKARIATVQDARVLARIQVDSYRKAYSGILPDSYLANFTYEEQEEDWRELIASGGQDILLAAETETGEVAGYALGRPGPTEIPPYDCELVALHVSQVHRRQGYGRLLVGDMARRLAALGCRSLLLWVLAQNRARAMYEHLGGVLVGEKTGLLGEGDAAAHEVAYGWENIRTLE